VSWLLLEKVPFVVLSVASAVITMKAQRAGGAVQTLAQYSPLLRFETAGIAYVRYLGKAFWPVNLVALYPHPTSLYPAWQVGAGLLILIVITAVVTVAVLRGVKLQVNSRCPSRRYLVFGWLWFLGALVPMLGLVQVGSQAMADRYAYIPFIGLFIMVTWLAADFARELHVPTAGLIALGVICLVVLGTLTYRQVGYWHDTQSFWERTIGLTKNNYVAHDSLGEYLLEEGGGNSEAEAAAHFRAALAIRPDDLPANLNLGAYEHGRGNLSAAVERYQVVALHAADLPLRAKAYGNLGSVYRQLGDLTAAKQCFEKSLELQPDHPLPMAFIGLGLVAQKSGDFAEAVRDYSRAMAIEPTDVGYLLVADALRQEGRLDEARGIEERVARLSPNLAAAQATARALNGK